jgi:hypothetical protein
MTPSDRLEKLYAKAVAKLEDFSVRSSVNRERIERVGQNTQNRACARLVMACLLAKLDRPDIDPRRPYTEIAEPGAFSGRSYDEDYITRFVTAHRLPCNSTTAFLTPALRNIDATLTPDKAIIGRPRDLYADALHLLEEVALGKEKAEAVLIDLIRVLVRVRIDHEKRLADLQADLRRSGQAVPLSSESIVTLLQQHLACPNASRLPVLIVTAAYQSVAAQLGEQPRPLTAHNAADEQTGAVGDVEITLVSAERVCTAYEMKRKAVTRADIDRALQKAARVDPRPDNYIFITTDPIDPAVRDYAGSLYEATGGIEFAILDCVGFARHFLHLFHRHRTAFLDMYQALVLAEPDSAVSFELKQALLALRGAALQPPAPDA